VKASSIDDVMLNYQYEKDTVCNVRTFSLIGVEQQAEEATESITPGNSIYTERSNTLEEGNGSPLVDC
jgi:hypothetical protein